MQNITALSIAFVGVLVPIIGTLVKLYGDIRVLRYNDEKNAAYIIDSEKSRNSVVTSISEIKTVLEFVKKDAEENKEFRTLVYDYMIEPKK
jgi:ABC-type multidrug transport system fused ATPase/permease subunit|tara:strand:- start:65 stop:337 length:273 start_codon:yes stop_codon:yes gene_type:complete